MGLTFSAIFAISFILSLGGTAAMRRVSTKLGFVDHPADRKLHTKPTPLGGGLAILAATMLTLLTCYAGLLYLRRQEPLPRIPDFIYLNMEGILHTGGSLVIILSAGVLLSIMGLVDDRRGLSAVFKLAVEIVLASVVVACGIRASMFIGDNPITWALSVLWIVGITNSFNLLDNMDGLSAGIAAIVGCILLVVALQCSPPHLFLAALLVVLLGAVTGFLVFNFPPASIFMGDCGSLFIGFMLAVASIQFTYVWPGLPTAKRLIPLAVPLLIFSVPIYDTASVVWIRIREGRHPFQPDKKHFSHRLLDLGMTRREALLTIYLVAFAIGVSATLLYSLEIPGAIVVLAQALGILSIIVLLEHTGLRRNHR